MQLWSGLLSNNSAKVRIALAEKGIAYETLDLVWTKANAWGEKPPAFLEVSPRGQVPVLVDDEVTVHDSTVINEYLEDKFPEPALFPNGAVARARCRLIEDDCDYWASAYVGVLIQEVFIGGRSESPAAREAVHGLHQAYAELSAKLGDDEWMCGDRFTVADIAVFLVVMFAQTMGASPDEQNLVDWQARMLARPSVKGEFEGMLAAAAVS